MISRCRAPGCSTIALGAFCIAHTPKIDRVFVRGRPWPPPEQLSGNTLRVAPVPIRATAPAWRPR